MKVSITIMPQHISGDGYSTVQVNDGSIQKKKTLLEALEMVHAKEFNNAQLNVESAASRLESAEACLAGFSTPADDVLRAATSRERKKES